MDEEIDMREVKKTLEDAGLFEPNIPDDVLVAYYKAVRDSENTASEENETRRLNESQEELIKVLDENLETSKTPSKNKDKPFTPKVWTSEKKLPQNDVPEHNNNHNVKEDNIDEVISDLPKDATKITFGFNEMIKDSEHTLNIITHELQFVPIHNSQQFLNAGTALKAKMLYAYHTKVNKIKGQLARMSFYPAPLPNVTSTTDTFPDFSNIDFQETYICRSGRQTKRKVYKDDEDEDSLDGMSHKKSKNSEEQEWLSKTPNKVSIRSNKKSDTSQASVETEKTNSRPTEGNNENAKLTNKLETKTPSRKLNNSEIMKRSSLFMDSPKPRCESMFEKLKEDEQKKLKDEKTMELFQKTLENLDEEHNSINKDDNEDIITVDDDEPIKRRVVPPVPGRRAINNRKRNKPDGLAPLEVTINSPSQKKETTANQNINSPFKEPTIENAVTKVSMKKRLSLRKTTSVPIIETDSLPSTSKLAKAESSEDDVTCPICNGSFHKDEIQEHASSCGDEPVTRSSSKISRITCEICDKVVNFDTSYEVHVKECIAKVNK